MAGKALVVYYSFSNTTRLLAEEIARIVSGDIRELVPEKAYSFSYNTAVKEARSEMERGYCPRLLSGNEPVTGYDIVFLGTPNWFKSYAPPVLSFLRNVDLKDKIIAPFCTHGGGGSGNIQQDITKECPQSTVFPAFATTSDFDSVQLHSWITSFGIATHE